MSLFTLARKKKAAAEQTQPCQHWDLAPRWDSAEDMGKAEKVTHYNCCACGARVSLEEARRDS